MFEQINEPVRVLSVCEPEGELLSPLRFVWHDRTVSVKSVNLSYSVWEGRNKVYYFAVSDSVNYYKLKFDPGNLKWTLVETYVE